MSSILADSSADILPARGLGGLLLGVALTSVAELLTGLSLWKSGSFELQTLYEAAYRLDEQKIEIAADVRVGKIFRLTALPGYKGALFGHIRAGMRVGDVFDAYPTFYYSEAEELIFVKDTPGVSLSISESDPHPAKVSSLSVAGISVFLPEIESASGQRGDWSRQY